MEFEIKKNNIQENKDNFSKSELDLGYEFAKEMKKEFGDFIKSIVLFGSSAKKQEEGTTKGDIDVLLVVDDLTFQLSPEFVEGYRIITETVIERVSTRLHVTSLRYITFWEYVREANPIAVNILRDGYPLVDVGFIAPLQHLLRQGRIRPTIESVWHYFARTGNSMQSARDHIVQAALDLYWSVIDSSQALLMQHHILSPAPEHVADLVQSELVSKGILKHHHVEIVKEFYSLSRLILHNELRSMNGKELDEFYKKAHEFVSDVKRELEHSSQQPK